MPIKVCLCKKVRGAVASSTTSSIRLTTVGSSDPGACPDAGGNMELGGGGGAAEVERSPSSYARPASARLPETWSINLSDPSSVLTTPTPTPTPPPPPPPPPPPAHPHP